MAKLVRYEWVIETIAKDDEYEDIQAVYHSDTFIGATEWAVILRADNWRVEVGLVRDVIDSFDDDLEDRQWAYLEEDGSLPQCFDDGAKVPKRFQKEVKGT